MLPIESDSILVFMVSTRLISSVQFSTRQIVTLSSGPVKGFAGFSSNIYLSRRLPFSFKADFRTAFKIKAAGRPDAFSCPEQRF
jgi:hypothetical protein